MTGSSRAASLAHYEELARIGKALSSPARLRLVDLLRQGPSSVESLAAQGHMSVANASQHLQQLKAARLVEADKAGHHVVYRLTDDAVSRFFGALRELAEALLPEMDRLREALDVHSAARRDELLERIRAGRVTLLDVRPAGEYEAGHLPGALSIPLDDLAARLNEIPKSREVIAYCRGRYCGLAHEAVTLLSSAGFRASHLDLGPADAGAHRLAVVVGKSRGTPRLVAPRAARERSRRSR